MIRKILFSAICMVAVLLCTSCAGSAGGSDGNVGYLVFSGNSRSLPYGKTYADLTSIELYGSYRGGSEKQLASWSTGSDLSGASVEVNVGRWDFRLTGVLSNGIYSKTISITITSGDNAATFNMQLIGYPLSTLSIGDIILDNGYGIDHTHYDDVSGVASGIAVVGYKSGNTIYAVGKTSVSEKFDWANAITAATRYNPATGSTSGATSGWILPDKELLKSIVSSSNKNLWSNSLYEIGGSAPESILWSSDEELSYTGEMKGSEIKINADGTISEYPEVKTAAHYICPIKIISQ